jgi:hypothetical protein
MSTPALIITAVANFAKMNDTVASADRALILGWLNEAIDRVSAEAEINNDASQTVALVANQDTYSIGTAPFTVTDLLGINDIRITDGAITQVPITQVTMSEINDMRQGSGNAPGSPYVYAVDYPQFVLYPKPSANTTLDFSYAASVPSVADNSTAITFIPAAFQWGCLFELAVWRALQYKQQPVAGEHYNAYVGDRTAGLPALRRWKGRIGGRTRADERSSQYRVTSPSQDTGWAF